MKNFIIFLLFFFNLAICQTFTDIDAGLTGVATCSVSWGDYDNDGDLDILITGSTGTGTISKIYQNNSGVFNDINAGLTGAYHPSVAWGDYDNDGDLDILITGVDISIIYNNDSGVFNDINAGLLGVGIGSVTWGDYDNDGDLDILRTGNDASIIYNNDSGVFTDINAGLISVQYSSSAWGDYDNDGDLDILVTGRNSDGGTHYISKIYRNDSGIFTDINAELIGIQYSSVAWGDYDNDGDLDILLTGSTGTGTISKIYRNDSGFFTDINAGLISVLRGSVAWGDYDNDGDLDILLSGSTDLTSRIAKIYRNNNIQSNTIPNSPTNLSYTYDTNNIELRWDKATDTETPQEGLSYNIYIGTESQNSNRKNPMSILSNGYRKVVDIGNAGQNNFWTIKDLRSYPSGTYYWSVQTIDHAYSGSEFSAEQSFTYTAPLTSPPTALDATNINYYNFTANWEPNGECLGYFLDVATDSMFTDFVTGYENLDVLNHTTYNINELVLGTIYYYRVSSYNGDFIPSGESNVIEVQTLLSDCPVNVEIFYEISTVTVSWSEFPNSTSYKIFASVNPYSGFVDVSSEGIFNGTSWSQIYTGNKRFYYVVAVIY